MSEVASTSDSDVQGLDCLLEQADQFQSGWTYGLSWSNPNDELRRLAWETAPSGSAPFKQLILARVFPRAIAGAPLRYSSNVRNGRFRMTHLPQHDDGPPTIISIPVSVQYPGGYVVHVTGTRLSVDVGPAPGTTLSRPQFPACPATPPAALWPAAATHPQPALRA